MDSTEFLRQWKKTEPLWTSVEYAYKHTIQIARRARSRRQMFNNIKLLNLAAFHFGECSVCMRFVFGCRNKSQSAA